MEVQAGKGEGGQIAALLWGWAAEAQCHHPHPPWGLYAETPHEGWAVWINRGASKQNRGKHQL